MIVGEPTRENVRWVADRMRQPDIDEFLAVNFADSHAELADQLVEKYAGNDSAFCFSDGDEPAAIGAMMLGRPNVITLAFFATDRFPRVALGIARFAKRELFPRYRAAGIHRIECISIDGYHELHRWLGIIGLKREAALRGFGKNGETFHQFAWVADRVG